MPEERGGAGVALVEHENVPGLEIIVDSDLDHGDLVGRLRAADSVIWSVTPPPDGSLRDGEENAGMAFAAGYALGLGLQLRVLVPSEGVRPLADIERFRSQRYSDVNQLVSLVRDWTHEFAERRKLPGEARRGDPGGIRHSVPTPTRIRNAR